MMSHEPSARPHTHRWLYGLAVLTLTGLAAAVLRLGGPERVDDPSKLDVAVHAWVVGHRAGWPALTRVLGVATLFGNFEVGCGATLLVAVALYVLGKPRRMGALVWLGTVGTGALWGTTLKAVFHRQRPPALDRLVTETSYSYPSSHSVFAAVFFGGLAVELGRSARDRRSRWASVALCLVLAVVVGLSRVWLGVHYPSDVLGGLILGSGWVLAVATVRRGWAHWLARKVRDA